MHARLEGFCVPTRLYRVVFLLFFLVFTVLRTAVNSDFVYSIDGMLCNLCGRVRDRIFPLSIGLSLSVVLVDTWIVERMTKVFTASAPSTMKIMVVAPPDENIFTVGCKCFRCAEVLLQPKTYEPLDGDISTVGCKSFRYAEVLLQPKTYEPPDGNISTVGCKCFPYAEVSFLPSFQPAGSSKHLSRAL